MKESGNLIGGLSVFVFYVLISVFPSAKADCTDYIYLKNEFDLKEAILTCFRDNIVMSIADFGNYAIIIYSIILKYINKIF